MGCVDGNAVDRGTPGCDVGACRGGTDDPGAPDILGGIGVGGGALGDPAYAPRDAGRSSRHA